ncbi:hypothetical protein T492DRAFT_863643 [Pavlovales sp. CCMP2436]|nr:hypothetical protein T492DRAFT_863643 [Pavlovales sp. CCMP2436]
MGRARTEFAAAARARSPLVIRGGCARWAVAKLWTDAHLRAAEHDTPVDVQPAPARPAAPRS